MDDLPYRSALSFKIPEAEPSPTDESDISTLKIVLEQLEIELARLNKDFNAFEILNSEDPNNAAEWLLIEIMAKKRAHDIIYPILDMVRDTIHGVDSINISEQ